jgi:[pyruvate, water dikinase]-phosphate phosphotransferase / [pyruvate, water dikinase] kinase
MPPRPVFYISDRTGITVETLGRSLLSQFESLVYTGTIVPFVDDDEKLHACIRRIEAAAVETGQRPLLFVTLVNREHQTRLAGCDALVVDFFRSHLGVLEGELGLPSAQRMGHTHGVRDPGQYEARMDTVNYALRTDDGSGAQQYAAADLIIVGVSRSGKTPTCLYLALQFGIRAANYPITEEDLEHLRLPAALLPHRKRLFGLMIDPERLQRIRNQRLPDSRYASLAQCRYELRQLQALFQREGIPWLDSTSMSVEEIATSILHASGLRR